MRETFSSASTTVREIRSMNLESETEVIFVPKSVIEESKNKILRGQFVICNGVFDFVIYKEEKIGELGETDD